MMDKRFLFVLICFIGTVSIRVFVHILREEPHAFTLRGGVGGRCIGNLHAIHDEKLWRIVHDSMKVLNHTGASVHFGTLLHFYRECALPGDTSDVDFAIPYREITDSLIKRFTEHGFKLDRTLGRMGAPGFEMSVMHPVGMRVDLFGIVDEEYYSWCPLWVQAEAPYKCRFPPSHLGTLEVAQGLRVPVREPVEPILAALYGLQWRERIKTKRWNWKNPVCT
jgi:hypothetical protein